MENLRLHFKADALGQGAQQADWPLDAGVHRMVRGDDGRLIVGGAVRGVPLAQFCMDRRGLWLLLSEQARGVHVNGRPVRRMALLRAGDSIHAEGVDLLVCADAQRAPTKKTPAPADEDVRIVLRGVGGKHHGRSFPLPDALSIGSADENDICIDGLAAHHASLQRNGEAVVLRLFDGAAACTVNGGECRDALLQVGDQVVFATQRFVLEVPQVGAREAASAPSPTAVDATAAQAVRTKPEARRWPWLLLAALLLGLALSALLLFGGR